MRLKFWFWFYDTQSHNQSTITKATTSTNHNRPKQCNTSKKPWQWDCKKNELPLARKQPKQVTRRRPLIRECIFQFNVKCELLDFYWTKTNFWNYPWRVKSLNILREWILQSGIGDPHVTVVKRGEYARASRDWLWFCFHWLKKWHEFSWPIT